MPKGLFSQGVAILLAKPIALDELVPLLNRFGTVSRAKGSDSWEIGGESLVIRFRPEANGGAAIDAVSRPWPDSMGDSKTEAALLCAWSMGHFGPFTYPGNLARAIQQSWSWPEARTQATRHQAFIRIRTSYIFGAGPQAKCLPPDYNSRDELEFLIKVVLALLEHPQSICYFNPNAELLLDRTVLDRSLHLASQEKRPPLDAWSNIRLFNIDEQWLLMDTVGMQQLDTLEHEACFRRDRCQPNDVALFLRNLSLYVLGKGDVIADGHTADGPANTRWRAQHCENSVSSPPRRVLRWLPCDGSEPPQIIRQAHKPPA